MGQWTGFDQLPEEMSAGKLARWKQSYPYQDPYFTYCLRYPGYNKTPLEYYGYVITDYRIGFEKELEALEEGRK